MKLNTINFNTDINNSKINLKILNKPFLVIGGAGIYWI